MRWGEWLLGVSGVLSLVFGALVSAQSEAGPEALIWIIGAYAVASGGLLLALSFNIRSWRPMLPLAFLLVVERWFAEITRQRIRRGTFESVPALVAAIVEYLAHYNQAPQPFAWTKDADTILAKIDRAKSCPKPSCAAH